MNRWFFSRKLGVALVVLSGAAAVLAFSAGSDAAGFQKTANEPHAVFESPANVRSFADVVEQVSPAVVNIKVTKTAESGEEIVLAHLGDGTFVGEMALLSESPRTASVIAEEETRLFVVSRDVLDQVVKNFPSVKHTLMRFYRQRLLSNLMATSPIFKPLDAEQRKSLIEKFKSREVPANEKILEQGQSGDGLYMLLSGQAEVSAKVNTKREVLAHLKGGDVFGEMSLLHNQPVSANIKTLRKSIVLKLPKRTFSEVISTHPQLLAHITEIANEREKLTKAIAEGKMRFSDEGLVVV